MTLEEIFNQATENILLKLREEQLDLIDYIEWKEML